MKQRQMGARLWGSLFGCLLLCLCLVPTASAQQTMGTVSVTVLDTSRAVVPGATLKLTDLATNDERTATTQEAGNYTFVNLNFGQYKLTVSLEGFKTQIFDVLVQSARTTDVKATLTVGGVETVVEVAGGTLLFLTTDERAFELNLEWDYELGTVHVCWEQGDVRFEPEQALAAGPEGLDAIRRIIEDARAHLKVGGWLLLEHGYDQTAVTALLRQYGYEAIHCYSDLSGRDRISEGRLP